MATIYFTNNADDSSDQETYPGSLRYAITSASDGDVIMYNGSAEGDVEIALNSALPSKSISIVGTPAHRIILNGQGVNRFYNVSTSLNITFQYVDFKNGARSDAAPIYISRIDSGGVWTFESCRFYGGTGNYAGGIQIANASTVGTVSFNNCVAFDNASTGSYNSGVPCPVFLYVATASTATVAINNCTLAKGETRASVGGLGGTVTKTNSLVEDDVDFSEVGFVDAASFDFRLTSGSAYLTGGATTGVDYLGHARSGSVGAFDGSWLVVPANLSEGISSNSTVDYLEVDDGGYIAFASGVFLTVKKGIYCGTGATFYSGLIGYLSAPTKPNSTFNGVRFATYGANVSAITATVNARTCSFVITKSGTPVCNCIEYQAVGETMWTLSNASSLDSSFTLGTDKAFKLRAFDGVSFVESAVVPRTYYYKGAASGGSFATASDWAMDSAKTMTCNSAPTIAGCSFDCT